MTDRHAGYIVVLEENIREDDAEHVINALRMVRGVQSVEPIVADHATQIALARARGELQRRLLDFHQRMVAGESP